MGAVKNGDLKYSGQGCLGRRGRVQESALLLPQATRCCMGIHFSLFLFIILFYFLCGHPFFSMGTFLEPSEYMFMQTFEKEQVTQSLSGVTCTSFRERFFKDQSR